MKIDLCKIDILGEYGYIRDAAKLCRDMKTTLSIRPTIVVSCLFFYYLFYFIDILYTQSIMMRNTINHDGLEDGLILLDKIRDKWKLKPDKKVSLFRIQIIK